MVTPRGSRVQIPATFNPRKVRGFPIPSEGTNVAVTEAKAKQAKSLIPRRIRNRIDAAFDCQIIHDGDNSTSESLAKSLKKFEKDKKEVLDFIEALLANQAG